MKMLHHTPRYKQSLDILKQNSQINTIVSHSLGSAIMTKIIEDNPRKYKGRGYGSPTVFPHRDITYYRHYGDPFSMYNIDSKQSSSNGFNPHSYSGFKKK